MRECPACHGQVAHTKKFCGHCGKSMPATGNPEEVIESVSKESTPAGSKPKKLLAFLMLALVIALGAIGWGIYSSISKGNVDANASPAASQDATPTLASAILPADCPVEWFQAVDPDLQAFNTEIVSGALVSCMIGYPNSDVVFNVRMEKVDDLSWANNLDMILESGYTEVDASSNADAPIYENLTAYRKLFFSEIAGQDVPQWWLRWRGISILTDVSNEGIYVLLDGLVSTSPDVQAELAVSGGED